MKPASIVYLVTRIHGLRTHLVQQHDMQILTKARSMKEIGDNLIKTEYGTEISKLPAKEVDAVALEQIFLKTLVDRFLFVTREAQGRMQDLLNRYCERFDVENIKRVIRAKHSGEILEEPSLIPIPREHTLVNFPALLNSKDVEEVVGLLRETPYRSLAQKLETYKQATVTIVLEAALDDIYFSRVWELAGKVSDAEAVKELIGEEIDLRNLLIGLSMKIRDLSPNLIEETFTSSHHRIPRGRLQSLAQARLEDAPSLLATQPYSKLASEAVKISRGGSQMALEVPFLRQMYDDASKALRIHSFDAGYIIAYLMLCECEARNLVTITTGKQLGLSEDEISQATLGIQSKA